MVGCLQENFRMPGKSFDAEFAKVAKFRKRSVVCDC